MKRRIIWFAVTMALMCSATVATTRIANEYKVVKINPTAALISCNDEREPVVRKFENTTMIVVTCQPVK
jgi:hypothetical protein